MVNRNLRQIAERLGRETLLREKAGENTLEHLPEIIRDSPEDYVLIPEKGALISKRLEYRNLEWEQTLRRVNEVGLGIPKIDVFMQYYLNLQAAAKEGRILYDAESNSIDRDEAVDLCDYVSSTYRGPFESNIFGTWLDARFEMPNPEKQYIITDSVTYNEGENISAQSFLLDPETYTRPIEGGYVNLDFNEWGLPLSGSLSQDYIQDENIYFWPPCSRFDIAWFTTDSRNATLDCAGDPTYHAPFLGVLPCHRGLSKDQFEGGKS